MENPFRKVWLENSTNRLVSRKDPVDHAYHIVCKGPSPPEDKQVTLIKVGAHGRACLPSKAFLESILLHKM